MDINKVGKFIASLRKAKGLTQQELGDKLFVTNKAVSKWERGLSFPDITILQKLANILEVDVVEILCGERGDNAKVNVQEEIDKAVKKIKENQVKKKQELIKKIKKATIIVIVGIAIIITCFLIRYKFYHPAVIKEGNNHYEIGFMGLSKLEKNGFEELISLISKTEEVKNLNSNVDYLNVSLSKNGNIEKMRFTLDFFDDNYNYVGTGYYIYDNKVLEFGYESKDNCKDRTTCEINMVITREYSKSLSVKYLSNQVKRIPLKKQIKLSNLKHYVVQISANDKFEEATSVFDMRDNKEIQALSYDDYQNGLGGSVKPGVYSLITLSNEDSMLSKEIYRYVFDNVDGDIRRVFNSAETDYYINAKKELLFTRDYSNNWIKTDIAPDDVTETLNFYHDISLPYRSWFISTNKLIPIAYFYGRKPRLKISIDNGESWFEKTFNIEDEVKYKEISNRIVGFKDQNFGYVALGTEWTMGSGEFKMAYITKDSGKTWEDINLPEAGTSKTLKDFIMYDENTGVLLLYNNESPDFPNMYITKDKGRNWKLVSYKEEVPDDVSYISNIDAIDKKDNYYIITLSLGDSATTKIRLKAADLINWKYDSRFTSSIHLVG